MRLQELFETSEEDRAIIALSSSVYNKIVTYVNSESKELVHIGKISNIADTPITAINNVSIELQGGESFIDRAKDPAEDPKMYEGKELLAFYEADTNTIVLNLDFLGRERMKTSITHELRHALDEIKSGSYPGNAKRYFTPKKKEHRKEDPYSTTQYRAQPAEINARFAEVLHKITDLVPKRYASVESNLLRRQLMHDFKNLLIKYEIADLFPEKTQSSDYKRLIKRVYDFMQKEMARIELQPGISKRATGQW